MSALASAIRPYARERELAILGVRALLECGQRPATDDDILDLCLHMFEGGLAAAHDHSLRWHYLADGTMPDDEITVWGAVRRLEDGHDSDTLIIEAYHDGDEGWCSVELAAPLRDCELYAWAHIVIPPAYRSTRLEKPPSHEH